VTDYPIIFSAPMVRALLDGRKTQTRRLAWRTVITYPGCPKSWQNGEHRPDGYTYLPTIWQKVKPGDRLYVRERFSYDRLDIDRDGMAPPWYWADGNPERGDWTKPKPSIHMPRWASRLTLGVTEKREQQLQDIGEDDAQAEGMRTAVGDGGSPGPGYKWTGTGYEGGIPYSFHTPSPNGRCSCKVGGPTPSQCAYRCLWKSLHGRDAWDSNPEVVALTFTVHQLNIDSMEAAA
jgi:hypothetical protein